MTQTAVLPPGTESMAQLEGQRSTLTSLLPDRGRCRSRTCAPVTWCNACAYICACDINFTDMICICIIMYNNITYPCMHDSQGRIQGEGTGGQFPPTPPQLWAFHSTQLIHKLQHSIVYTTCSVIKHTKLCLKVQIFVEIEHFAARKQAIAANRRRGLSILGAWPKILRALCHPLLKILDPPLIVYLAKFKSDNGL